MWLKDMLQLKNAKFLFCSILLSHDCHPLLLPDFSGVQSVFQPKKSEKDKPKAIDTMLEKIKK